MFSSFRVRSSAAKHAQSSSRGSCETATSSSKHAKTSSRDLSEVVASFLIQDVHGALSTLRDMGISVPANFNSVAEDDLAELEVALVRGGLPILDRLKILRAAVDGFSQRPHLQFSMAAGKQDRYIIGVVRINSFATISSVLQEKTITFLNQIAEIIHGLVNRFRTADVKVFGDTTLIMWQVTESDSDAVSSAGDIPLFALAKLIAAVHSSPIIASYRRHPGLQQRLGTQWRVSVNCGLHFGSVVKGAIGNELAMQAAYVSSDIQLASVVERASQIYRVPFLFSQALSQVCSRDLLAKFRQIDKILVDGCSSPMDLFSFDLYCEALEIEDDISLQIAWNSDSHCKTHEILQQNIVEVESRVNAAESVLADSQIEIMRRRYSVEFTQVFRMGFQNYLEGEWDVARRMLMMAKGMLGFEDGPCKTLLEFMEQFEFQQPPGWSGCHDLQGTLVGGGWL